MNLEYDDARITCSNCGTRYFAEVGMSPCPNCSPWGDNNNQQNKSSNMGWYEPESECTADAGVMGHLGCSNPNCSCKSSSSSTPDFSKPDSFDYQGNLYPPHYTSTYTPPDVKLKHKGLIHQTLKANLFAIKLSGSIYEIWIPKSCVLGLTDKKVTVSNSFYIKSVLKQAREQGCQI